MPLGEWFWREVAITLSWATVPAGLFADYNGVYHKGNRLTEGHRLEAFESDLAKVDTILRGKFNQTLTVESIP
jgi:hypothetical protein